MAVDIQDIQEFLDQIEKEPALKQSVTALLAAARAQPQPNRMTYEEFLSWAYEYTLAEGENKENTEWVNVEAWGRLGEVCQQYLHKGSLIFLEGRLKTNKYEDKGGETKYYTKVVALSMQMLDRKPEDEPVATVEEAPAEYEA